MKKDFGVKTWLYPMLVLMIATYNEVGTPNVMNAAWGGTDGEETLTICIDNTHKTWVASPTSSVPRSLRMLWWNHSDAFC